MPVITSSTTLQSFTATADGASMSVNTRGMAFVEGTFAGTVVLECKPPGATGFVAAASRELAAYSRTAPSAFAFESVEGTLWRWRCSAYTSGTIVTGIVAA